MKDPSRLSALEAAEIARAWMSLSNREQQKIPSKLRIALGKLVDRKYYVGKLCKHGHTFEGKERSLRYRSMYACVECISEYSKAHPSVRKARTATGEERTG
jgi:hypothetical protein